MLQDYLKGRPMEIEAQLIAPLEFARRERGDLDLDMIIPACCSQGRIEGLV